MGAIEPCGGGHYSRSLKQLTLSPAHLRDLFKRHRKPRRFLDERHDEMIRQDIVEISRMHKDVGVPKEAFDRRFLVLVYRQGDVKAALRFNKGTTCKRRHCGVSTSFHPVFVVRQKRL